MHIRLNVIFLCSMILFYSEFCQHCNVLLETIKRHDKNNMIKLVSIDLLRTLKKQIDPKIHSVPALLLVKNKEYLFGKAVFDYLLLPNRGVLFTAQTSRDTKTSKEVSESGINSVANNNTDIVEPMAFTLGAISAEQFSSIDDDTGNGNSIINDKNYNWDMIDNANTNISADIDIHKQSNSDYEGKSKGKIPSMEEIMKQRANDII